jgi:hypothetical protein
MAERRQGGGPCGKWPSRTGAATTTARECGEDGDTVVVRGDMVDRATLERADDEAVVRLPRAMVLQAAERLRQG